MTVIKTSNNTIEALLKKTLETNTTEHITGHTPTPPITDATAIIHYTGKYGHRLNIIHTEKHVTTHKITLTNNTIQFNSTVRITTDEPKRITPADDVYMYGNVKCIQHGPGHETRILPTH